MLTTTMEATSKAASERIGFAPPIRHNHIFDSGSAVAAASRPQVTTLRRSAGIEVRGMAPADVLPAARLLALRHRRARQATPELPGSYQSAQPWFVELARGFERKRAVVAARGGEVVGFMIAEPGMLGNAVVTQSGVAEGADPARVYGEMCAALSEQR